VTECGVFRGTCSYCGAVESRRLGECSVCNRSVCEKCGNVQFSGNGRHVTHKSCLKKADGGFKMIKFVD